MPVRYPLSHVQGWAASFAAKSAIVPLVGVLFFAQFLGCSSELQRNSIVPVELGEFGGDGDAKLGADTVDAASSAEGTPVVDKQVQDVDNGKHGIKTTNRVIETDGEIDSEVQTFAMEIPVGDRYTIDGLVGQINGRPIYADEFLLPIADRIIRLASDPNVPRPAAVREIEKLVASRFNDVVDSELIIAEAESSLSPEMQQGIFGWLQSIQEQTIAERGGTRATAEASIGEEFQITLDEFLEQRKTVALAMNLLRKRVEPRAIVSWRDIEQEYRRRWSDYNPPAIMRIGRIRFSKTRQAEEIERVTALISEGKSFQEIASELKIPDEGVWLQVELPKNGIEGTTLSPAIKELLDGLKIDSVSPPLDQTAFKSWFTVLDISHPEGESIYTTAVQIQLKSYLRDLRERQERERYISTLRSRWINDDINKMQLRLIRIAKDRYVTD